MHIQTFFPGPLRHVGFLMVLGLLLAGCAAGGKKPVDLSWQCDPKGDAAVAAGDWQQGLKAHQNLLDSDPSNCLAMFHLGYIWGQLDDRQKEIDFYRYALACGYNQDDHLFFNLGMAHAALGQMDAALGAMERALELGPANADNYFGMGLIAGKAGYAERAVTAMEKAVALDPLYHEARVELIRFYLDNSRWQDARRHLLALEQRDPQNIELSGLWETLHRRWME